MSSPNRILVIAGSDSSGGAGLEADQKVVAAHGCYAMTATTALTAQNTQGVYGIHETPSDFVAKQIDACVEDVGVDVVKTGMLASATTIKVVAESIRKHNIQRLVVDPVMVATSGAQLLPADAVKVLIEHLLPLTTILTPNLPEAKLLLQTAGQVCEGPKTVDDIVAMAKSLRNLGPKYVLLKGGHIPLNKDRVVPSDEAERHTVLNVLAGEAETVFIENSYLRSKNTHGTGCSLASAIASNLSKGIEVSRAVKLANQYVEAGIQYSIDLGKGSGPINHFHSLYALPFSRGRFIDYLLDRPDVQGPWKEYTEHEFVQKLAAGTLPVERFKNYLVQDYLYLTQFSRSHALAAYKADNLVDINRSAKIVGHIQQEVKLHIDYCAGFGLTEPEMAASEENQACTAYSRYCLDIGQSQDWFALQISLLPCLLGYGMIAERLHSDPNTKRDGNIYWKWICNYVEEDYRDAVKVGVELVEEHAAKQSANRIEQLVKIFIHATKMETGFWDAAQ